MGRPTTNHEHLTEEDLKASGWENGRENPFRLYWKSDARSWENPAVLGGRPHTFGEAVRAEEARRKADGGG